MVTTANRAHGPSIFLSKSSFQGPQGSRPHSSLQHANLSPPAKTMWLGCGALRTFLKPGRFPPRPSLDSQTRSEC
jgi:hypothetical protein